MAYIASETLTHSEIVPEDEQGANIWDILIQRFASREPRQSGTFWDAGEDVQEEDQKYGYDNEDPDETIRGPSRRRLRPNILDDEDEEEDDHEPFNTPESSAEHTLYYSRGPRTLPRVGNALLQPKRQGPSAPKEGNLKHQHLGQLWPEYRRSGDFGA